MTDTVTDCGTNFFFGSIVGLLGWFFGGLDGFVRVLITFIYQGLPSPFG